MGDGFLDAAVVVVRTDQDDPSEVLVGLHSYDYQPGTIEHRINGAIQVAMKDGSTVWTTWAKCRTKQQK